MGEEDIIRVSMDFNFFLQSDMLYVLYIFMKAWLIDWILLRDSRFSISMNCVSNIVIFQSFMIFLIFCVIIRYIQTLVDWLRYIIWARRILEYESISTFFLHIICNIIYFLGLLNFHIFFSGGKIIFLPFRRN